MANLRLPQATCSADGADSQATATVLAMDRIRIVAFGHAFGTDLRGERLSACLCQLGGHNPGGYDDEAVA